MQPPDSQDADPPNLRSSMDPLISAMPLTAVQPNGRAGLYPYAAPSKGTIERPDFRTVGPPREIVPESVPVLDTHAQLQRDQERRERQAQADRERIASMPTQADLLARRIGALEADVNAQRVVIATLERRLAQLESLTLARSRSPGRRHPDDDRTPPRAA